MVQSPEQCDDGNTITETCAYGLKSCTVCNSTCQLVAGAVSYCGDGATQSTSGEQCDDGNTSNLDLCSTACKTCGQLVGPLLSQANDNDGESGIEFIATANATLYQFTAHTQGKGAVILLRANSQANEPIVQMMTLPPNLDASGNTISPTTVTVNVSWPLTAGTTYTLTDRLASDGYIASVTGRFPDSTLPGVTVVGSWDAANTDNPDNPIPESINDSFWYTFEAIHTCLR
jgi:cysteine-rich repeat protein